jgi:hypothetical protein
MDSVKTSLSHTWQAYPSVVVELLQAAERSANTRLIAPELPDELIARRQRQQRGPSLSLDITKRYLVRGPFACAVVPGFC